MKNNSLYEVYVDCDLRTKADVYAFIAKNVTPKNPLHQQGIIAQLAAREKIGSTQISDHVMLPHIESNQIIQSKIMFIRLSEPIMSWDSSIKDIRLIIALLLKENETDKMKRTIASFTKTLADEAYVEKLLHVKEASAFYKTIIKKQEEL